MCIRDSTMHVIPVTKCWWKLVGVGVEESTKNYIKLVLGESHGIPFLKLGWNPVKIPVLWDAECNFRSISFKSDHWKCDSWLSVAALSINSWQNCQIYTENKLEMSGSQVLWWTDCRACLWPSYCSSLFLVGGNSWNSIFQLEWEPCDHDHYWWGGDRSA